MIFAVLKDKDTFRVEEPLLKNQVGYRRQFLQGIGRIGKDKVKLLLARLHIPEHIAANRNQGSVPLIPKFLHTLLDEAVVVSVKFYADNLTATSGHQFE